jgi:hypothetical protein
MSFDQVQRKIYGQRIEDITPVETYEFFKAPVTPEFNLILLRALQVKALDPDVSILQALATATNKQYLIPIALCLREGVDTNMYVAMPGVGTIHLLGYIYLSFIKLYGDEVFNQASYVSTTDENALPWNNTYNPITYNTPSEDLIVHESSNYNLNDSVVLLNVVVLMLLIRGSRPQMPMFDDNAGKIAPPDDIVKRFQTNYTVVRTNNSRISVVDWLRSQGYNTVLEQITIGVAANLQTVIDDNSMNLLSIILDDPTIRGRDYVASDYDLAIQAYSSVVIQQIPIPTDIVIMDYRVLNMAVDYLNAAVFINLVNQGYEPSYLLLTKIIVAMKIYYDLKHAVSYQELEKMLMASLNAGIQLDNDLIAIVSTIGSNLLDAVMKVYKQPYWKKVCNAKGTEVPEALRKLAMSLNIGIDGKAGICDRLLALSRADKEALKQAARVRQQQRMSADVATTDQYLNDKTPTVMCHNRSLLAHDPDEYNDIDIAYYKDDQGAVWCFTSDAFNTLLKTRMNPYNNTALPQFFLDKVSYQLNMLQRLGLENITQIITMKAPMTYGEALDKLNEVDVISNIESEDAVNTFIQLGVQNNFSLLSIRDLTKEQMMAALRTIGYDIDLKLLTDSHALIITARLLKYVASKRADAVPVFFASLGGGTVGLPI